MADILKAIFLKHIGGKTAFLEYHIAHAVAHKLGKLFLYRFYGQVVEDIVGIGYPEIPHVLRQYFIYPLLGKTINTAFYAGSIRAVLVMEFRYNTRPVLFLQFPHVSHNAPETFMAAVGVHKVE